MLAVAPKGTGILTAHILTGSKDMFRDHRAPVDSDGMATASTVGLTAQYRDQKTNHMVIFWLYFCVRLTKARELGTERRV